nr:HepT-like ribonuclease domain-containing protein [Candidatus Protofrankia californiensis]
MRPDPRKYLWDAVNAAELARGFAQGRSFEDYLSNAMLRAAVEREFEIIGEALNQLSRVAPEIASAIPELPRIVAFRNILIHGYATVDDALVWQVLKEKLPELEQVIRDMLDGS